MTDTADEISFIKNTVSKWIMETNEELNSEKIADCIVSKYSHLDGFMSTIYSMELTLQSNVNSIIPIFIKVMKGENKFRKDVLGDIQFANEIYIYTKVIPVFEEILKSIVTSGDKLTTRNWVPNIYYGVYGIIPNSIYEIESSILAIENIKPLNYRSGPKVELDQPHLELMVKKLAEYHSVTYAMRLNNDPKLQQLIDGIIPLPFKPLPGETNVYEVIYSVALERYCGHIDKSKDTWHSDFASCMTVFKEKYGKSPLDLLEKYRETDDTFSTILHGDYNRNNVLFKYDSMDGFENPIDMKMIDFQEVRYGSPALDLSFFMYINMDSNLRRDIWDHLLKLYNQSVLEFLSKLLNCNVDDEILEPYSYDNFIRHFKRFGFYGGMICLHFLPWVTAPEADLDRISTLFEENMHSKELHDILMVVGGEETDQRLTDVVQHAWEHGYLEIL